jgi:hypothetical protein
MSVDGWNMDAVGMPGSEADLPALRALVQAWPTLSAAEREQQVAALQARYPDLELTTEDVAMIVAKFHEMGDLP